MRGDYKLKANDYFEIISYRTRGREDKIRKQHSVTSIHNNYFSNRIVKSWNKLSIATILSPIVVIFKDRLAMDTFEYLPDPLFSFK